MTKRTRPPAKSPVAVPTAPAAAAAGPKATHTTAAGRPRAVLVGVQLPGVSEEEHNASLDELGRLVDTLGFDVVHRLSQKRSHLSSGAGLGCGKLKELAALTGGTGVIPSGAQKKIQKKEWHEPGADPVEEDADTDADDEAEAALTRPPPAVLANVVVVDNELTPSQLRNLERATGVEVLDRAFVIIEIFWRHARTKEAQLQVEVARLQYEAPRLREKEHTGDRQRGGGVGGKGDNDLEVDKRRIRDRITELNEQLEAFKEEDATRRARRKDASRVALVGYTNAGKSTWMRALTGSDVLVADKLFATLGTTVRALVPETQPRILVSDTVGFIKSLPHSLVASFRSTLEEAHEASLLLFVVDASDASFRSQLEVTKTVLGEIEASSIPSILVLNKADRLDAAARKKLTREFGKAAFMGSALNPDDVTALRARIVEFFEDAMEDKVVTLPYARQALMGSIRELCRVTHEAWDEAGVQLTVRAPPAHLQRVEALLRGTDGKAAPGADRA